MSPDAIEGIVASVRRPPPDPRHRPRRARPARGRPRALPDDDRRRHRRRARRRDLPARLGGARSRPGRGPQPTDVFELVFTSGTTGTPKGVMLAHDNVVASIESFHRIVPPMEHRIVSLLPLSHLLEQAVGLYYALIGRRRHPVRPEPQPAGHLRCAARPPGDLDGRRPAGPRPVLERHRARGRQARPRGRVRPPARRRPAPARTALRRLLFGSVHTQLGGAVPAVPVGRRVPAAGRSSRPGRTSA